MANVFQILEQWPVRVVVSCRTLADAQAVLAQHGHRWAMPIIIRLEA
jgi:hypothetical protein